MSAAFPFVFNFISLFFFELYCVGLSKCLYLFVFFKVSYFFLFTKLPVVTVVSEKKSVLILLYCIVLHC